MKTVTIQFLRCNMGKMFHEISERKISYLLTKAGKPVAKLVPLDDTIEIMPDGEIRGERPMTMADRFLEQCKVCRGAGYTKAHYYGGDINQIKVMAEHFPNRPVPVHRDECKRCGGTGKVYAG
jgi:antitoxin (DNA-binding transcriptional repressor) of toxin-antitoxin stability system